MKNTDPYDALRANNSSKTIRLKNGGTLTLFVASNSFLWSPVDRDFVFRLLDMMRQYEDQDIMTGEKGHITENGQIAGDAVTEPER